MAALRLSSLHIHPVKSARGYEVAAARLDRRGLEHDRRFMVVGEDGVFLTQRQHPSMARIALAHEGDRFIARAPEAAPFFLPTSPTGGEPRRVRVWDDEVAARSLGDDARRWFSAALGVACDLVYFPDDTVRPVDPDYAPSGTQVGFADGFPFLLISEASLVELNRRLPAPVTMERFRPNLVVAGAEPFDEDRWRQITIGGLRFDVVKPCARCPIPNVDPETGEPGPEPLRTLAHFRTVDHRVLFGQNVLGPTSGTLTVGDAVEVVA